VTGNLLYPRLPREEGRKLLLGQSAMDLRGLYEVAALDHPAAAPAATGGRPVEQSRLELVQRAVRDAAVQAGYPDPLPRGSEQRFDRPCGTALFEVMRIVPADAATEDVWTFLSLVVVPEIGPWRFPERAEDRILGRPRNVLRRLWWRAWALGPDLDVAPEGCTPFGEDEFVGIMERPSIGGNPRVACAVRDSIWRAEAIGSGVGRSDVAREVTRRFRAFMSHIAVDALGDEELSALLDEIVDTSLASVAASRRR
jgi:hypothetical protein